MTFRPPKKKKPTGPSGPTAPTGPTSPAIVTGPSGPTARDTGDVTAQSDFRALGNTDRAAFTRALERTAGARSNAALMREADAVYDTVAAHGLSRLAAVMAWEERKNDTHEPSFSYYGPDFHNLFALTGGNPRNRFSAFASYDDGAREWAWRILSPDGPYASARSISEFMHIYAPPFENDTAGYIRRVVAGVNALPLASAAPTGPTSPTGPAVDPWRPYPWPKMIRMIVPKPWEGAGFDRVPLRRDRIRGVCSHITDGTGTIEGIRDLFATGGQRQADALTDLVTGRDGRIGLLNDWRDANAGGTRAGWANGGVNGLEEEGIAFYRRYPEINSVLISNENISRAGQAWTDAQIEMNIELKTANAQALRCPWDAYPFHPEFGGVSIDQSHWKFATKSCADWPYRSEYEAMQRREVKAKLKAHQGGQPSPPPAPPPEPDRYTRFGFTLDQVRYLFGVMQRINADGTTDELAFNPDGPLSILWLQRCEREGIFPEAETLRAFDSLLADGSEWFATWEGGWTAYLPIDNARAGWRWLDAPRELVPAGVAELGFV